MPLLAAAQACGIALADRGVLRPDAALVLGVSAVVVALLATHSPRARAALALLTALSAGGFALGARVDDAARARPHRSAELTVEATVQSAARGAHWMRVELEDVVALTPAEAIAAPRRVTLLDRRSPRDGASLESALPGERIRARLRLRAPRGLRNPGSRDGAERARRAGVGAVGRLVHPSLHARLPEREGSRPLRALDALRMDAIRRLEGEGRGGALVRALALGDRGGLRPEAQTAFASLGLAHLLAVSGLHLALVASLAYLLAHVVLTRSAASTARWDLRGLALLLALLAATLYAAVAGWGVPVRRALVLLLALALGLARGRPALPAQPLAAAALGILAVEPHALFDAGAQLSFAASAAFAAAATQVDRPASRIAQGLHDTLRTSATALAATAPLAAYHIGSAAPFALVANLLAVPWTAAVLLPACLAGALGAASGGAVGDGIVTMASHVAGFTLAAVEWLAARVPGSGPGARPALGWILAAAVLALLALRAPLTHMRVALAAALTGLLALAPPAGIDPAPPRVVFLDVGQGDSTLVQGRRGAVLVDAGTASPDGPDLGRRAVVPALHALGVRRLDLVLATHADLDHRGGLPAVLESLPVGALWVPPGGRDQPGFAALLRAAALRGVPVVERGAGSPAARAGDLEITPLWPPVGAIPASSNDGSLVVRIEVGGRRVLLPGDIERRAELALLRGGADLHADLLKLPHHGSRSSSTARFLEAVGATLVVVSAPWQGRFGMPHAEVLERAQAADVSVWWTGRDGAVMVGLGERVVAWGLRSP